MVSIFIPIYSTLNMQLEIFFFPFNDFIEFNVHILCHFLVYTPHCFSILILAYVLLFFLTPYSKHEFLTHWTFYQLVTAMTVTINEQDKDFSNTLKLTWLPADEIEQSIPVTVCQFFYFFILFLVCWFNTANFAPSLVSIQDFVIFVILFVLQSPFISRYKYWEYIVFSYF